MIVDQVLTGDKENPEKSFQEVKNSENATRSIAKAISWRIVGTIDTIVISFFLSVYLSVEFIFCSSLLTNSGFFFNTITFLAPLAVFLTIFFQKEFDRYKYQFVPINA